MAECVSNSLVSLKSKSSYSLSFPLSVFAALCIVDGLVGLASWFEILL